MSDVAIVGIGMHEFGRTEGVSGMDQGVVAVRRALADCGLQWSDMEFAFGGSMATGAADTMVSRVGLTGLPFTNVLNGCATGGTALNQTVNTIEAGAFDLGIVVGFDKHERGAFRVKGPRGKDWYGGSGLALTTQFFGMKINRYMHEYGITQPTLAKAFSPSPVLIGQVSRLTLTINNGSGVALSGVALADSLPDGVALVAAPNATTTCNNGVVTANPGGGVLSIAGAVLANGASCTFSADVLANTTGSFANAIPAGALVTDQGLTNPAQVDAILDVLPPASVT